MGSLPTKAVTGANFKKWTVETLNKLIDYLHGARIKPGYGIMVRETPSGTIVELAKKQAPVVNNTTGGGTGVTQDISASVSGGTASVTLSGSTSAVEFVGTGDVTISGNTNGQIEIGVSGGTGGGGGGAFGFPDYTNVVVAHGLVDLTGTTTYLYDYPVWLMGTVGMNIDQNGDTWGFIDMWINSSPNQERIELFGINATAEDNARIDAISAFVSIAIPANTPFYFTPNATDLNYCRNDLRIYGCLGQNPPLADYTVTRASGNTNGTLFYGLSQQGDNTVSVDSSLNGTPLDFEGASVL